MKGVRQTEILKVSLCITIVVCHLNILDTQVARLKVA